MLAKLYAVDRSVDRPIVRSGDYLCWVTFPLGIKRVDLAHATTKPNGDDMFGFAVQQSVA